MFGSHILKNNRQTLGNWKATIGAYNVGLANTEKEKKTKLLL